MLVASLQNISPQRNQVTILVVIDLLNKYLVCYSHIRYPIKNKILGLERCLRSQEYVSFLQRAQVQFSAPVPSSLQQPGTLAPETLLAPQALGFKRTFPHTETRILILKMKFFFFNKHFCILKLKLLVVGVVYNVLPADTEGPLPSVLRVRAL